MVFLRAKASKPCTSLEDVQVISRSPAGAPAPTTNGGSRRKRAGREYIDGGPSLYGNGLVGLRMDGPASHGASTASRPSGHACSRGRPTAHAPPPAPGPREQACSSGQEGGKGKEEEREGREEEAGPEGLRKKACEEGGEEISAEARQAGRREEDEEERPPEIARPPALTSPGPPGPAPTRS